MLAAAVVVAIALIRAGLDGRDRQAIVLAVGLMLVASPLVWSHYFALLVVVLVLVRPRLSALWFLPVVLWACPVTTPDGWQLAIAWSAAGGCLLASLRGNPAGRWSADRRPRADRPMNLLTSA